MGSAVQHHTVERIMDAATSDFAGNGFDGARMDNIAKLARVNKATIYYHIGDKEALYSAVLHRVFGELAEHIARQVEATSSTEDQLKVVIRSLRRLIEEKSHVSAILMHEIASGGRHFPEELFRDFSQIIGLTDDALKKGQKAGEFIKVHPMVVYLMAITPMAFYEKLYSGIYGQLVSGYKELGIPMVTFEAFADQLESLVLNALQNKTVIDPKA